MTTAAAPVSNVAPVSRQALAAQVEREQAAKTPITAEQGARLLGLDLDQLRADAPADLAPHLDRTLSDSGWVIHTAHTASTPGVGRPGTSELTTRVWERCRSHAQAAANAEQQRRRWQADHTCQVLGTVDPSTSRRRLPWGGQAQLSDRGLAATWAAWLTTASDTDIEQARRLFDLPQPTDPDTGRKRRR